MMNRWNATMSNAAASVAHLFVEKNRVSGATISTNVPLTCAIKCATRDGRKSRGKSR
jgi:hypothetical protein